MYDDIWWYFLAALIVSHGNWGRGICSKHLLLCKFSYVYFSNIYICVNVYIYITPLIWKHQFDLKTPFYMKVAFNGIHNEAAVQWPFAFFYVPFRDWNMRVTGLPQVAGSYHQILLVIFVVAVLPFVFRTHAIHWQTRRRMARERREM